ncbi:MAG: DEAD/DEAH box helicase [Spirochaetaceae bacterium]|nr:DEAD/DEAH box helicase [Spirochaetaceae bacterium]
MEEKIKFDDLGLSEATLSGIRKKGFEEPSPIQAKTIPYLLQGEKNIIGQAQTGTGKTAAFGLPLIDKLEPDTGHVQALILAPTRELAVQVCEEINSLKGSKRLQIAPIYGGQSYGEQFRRLKRGVDIIVGTPGRIQDHIDKGSLNLSKLSWLILDEADEMLNMGFVEDIEKILESVNEDKRMVLFSATMPKAILNIAGRYMGDYEVLAVKKQQLTTNLTEQIYYELSERDKFEALCRIIDIEDDFYGIVFCRTKVRSDEVAERLINRGYSSAALHGDISQNMRERILSQFKEKKTNILVATDVAARGIDVTNMTHVINYSLPQDPESYVHRIGRTGRAGQEGTAITFVTHSEYRMLVRIQRMSNTDIKKKTLPGVKDVIHIKRERIITELSETIQGNLEKVNESYDSMAKTLLEQGNPEQVVASLLKYSFKQDLDESQYKEIKNIKMNRDGSRTRLFVAKGRKDNMSARDVVSLIKEKTGIPDSRIDDVQVFEMFSFITVSFDDAEHIIDVFRKAGRGHRPMVEKAKPSDNNRRRGPSDGRPRGAGNRQGGHFYHSERKRGNNKRSR